MGQEIKCVYVFLKHVLTSIIEKVQFAVPTDKNSTQSEMV